MSGCCNTSASCCTTPPITSAPAPCPSCGQPGQPVPGITVLSLVRHPLDPTVADIPWQACLNHDCPVVYFSPDAPVSFSAGDLTVPVWWKDDGDDVPLCYCKHVTRGNIKEAIYQAGKHSVQEVLAYTGAFGSQCLIKNPLGRCCHQNITVFIREELGK